MEELYRKALDRAGYTHAEANGENVRECFEDYVDAGYWTNINHEDMEDMTTIEMCQALLKV